MSNPVEILTAERQEFSIGSQLAAYLVALTARAPGAILFRTGAGRIYRDLLIHWPTLEEWEDEAQELCQRIADAIYPLAGALYAQAVELSVVISFAPMTPPSRVDALSTYVMFDADAGTEAHYYLSPQHPLPPHEQLSLTRGVIVLGRPLQYSYHTIKDDRSKINHPHAGLYELSQRLVNEMYEQPLFVPRDRAVLSKVKAQIKALPEAIKRAESSRNANLAKPTRHLIYTAPRIATVTSLSALPPPVRALERRLMVHVMDKTLSPELRFQLRRAAQTIRAHFPQVMIDEAAHRETRPTAKLSASPTRKADIPAQTVSSPSRSDIALPPRQQPATPKAAPPVNQINIRPALTMRFVPSAIPFSVPPTVIAPALQQGLQRTSPPPSTRISFAPGPLPAAPTSGIISSPPRIVPSASISAPPPARKAEQHTSSPRLPEPPRPQPETTHPQQRPAQQTRAQPSPARQTAAQPASASAKPTEKPARAVSTSPVPKQENRNTAQRPQRQASPEQQEFRLDAHQDRRLQQKSNFPLDQERKIKAPTVHRVAGRDIRPENFYDQIRTHTHDTDYSREKRFTPNTRPTSPEIFPRAESVGRLNATAHTAMPSTTSKATTELHASWSFPAPFLGLFPHNPKTKGKK